MQKPVRRFMHWEDAHLSLFGKLLLMEACRRAGYDDDLGKIEYTEFNRPYLPFFKFNISHSAKIAVCVWSEETEVGIDIEKIKPIDYEQFTDQFTDDELCAMRLADNPLVEFYKQWTKKEAIIKADGQGLSIPLKTITFANPFQANVNEAQWFLREVALHPEYICHLASQSLAEIKVIQCSF